MPYTPASEPSADAEPHRREESFINPLRISLFPALSAALASVLLFASALPASALGTSPPPEPARPAQSAPGATTTPKPAAAPPATQPVSGAIAVQDIPLEADRLLTVLRALEERFLAATRKGQSPSPSFEDGLRAQAVLDAVLESIASGGRMVSI